MTLISEQKFTVSRFQLITMVVAIFGLVMAGVTNAQVAGGADHSSDERMSLVIGENSVLLQVPARYRVLNSKEGFTYSLNNERLDLKNAYFFRSFENDTYIALDVYNGSGRAASLMFDDIVKGNLKKGETIKGKGFVVRKAFLDSDTLTVRQQYASIDGLVVILTTASRKGETPEMKSFLSSVRFSPDTKSIASTDLVSLANLKMTELNLSILDENDDAKDRDTADDQKNETQDENSLRIFSIPKPGYTSSARFRGIQGEVRLKITFGNDGFIPAIAVRQALPQGLLRQALFSALRIKYLPRIENGQPVDLVRDVTYNFGIY
ncbi:MAG: energy transducer TonB [Acidobacteria bacterium]|nr:energy transducer TonB [Acidobacteriota bacterium]